MKSDVYLLLIKYANYTYVSFEISTFVIPHTIKYYLSVFISNIQKTPTAVKDAAGPASFVHDFVIVDAFTKSISAVCLSMSLSEVFPFETKLAVLSFLFGFDNRCFLAGYAVRVVFKNLPKCKESRVLSRFELLK